LADIVDPRKRSEMMAGIRAKNTKPELVVRRLLHSLGYRFRLHRKDLPGKPDIVLPKMENRNLCPRLLLARTRELPAVSIA